MSTGLGATGGIIIKLMHFFLESPFGRRGCGCIPVTRLPPFRINKVVRLLLGLPMMGWEKYNQDNGHEAKI